jgi:hypothetical protein
MLHKIQQWYPIMVDELKDACGRVVTMPQTLYSKFWEQCPLSMTTYEKVCPMDVSMEVVPLLKWECSHLGLSIATSHIEVQTIAWVVLVAIVCHLSSPLNAGGWPWFICNTPYSKGKNYWDGLGSLRGSSSR